jgi:biotin-dependent carboxylase-like uncharacterized protein
MDRASLFIANALVGNRATEAALEFAYAAGEWIVEAPSCRIAVGGGPFQITVDGEKKPALASMVLKRGQHLRIGSAPGRVWGYLSVAGGFDLPLDFGGRSTHVQSSIGGFKGRSVRAGDALAIRFPEAPSEPERAMPVSLDEEGPYRVVLGPQQDHFDKDALALFLTSEYQVTWQQNRMAYRLEGPALTHARGYNIITDGVMPGCIQIPGTGLPIVLMRDAGTVGGYPKIGTIIESDLGRLAQQRPGTHIRFEPIDVADAQVLRRRFLARLQLTAEATLYLTS